MESLLNAFRSLGPARILALFVGLAATIAIGGMVAGNLSNPGTALLYGGLSSQEASSITQYLDSQNIKYETKGEGSVYVPANMVGQLRLQVAGQGLVGGSNAGYELFDNASAFGTTSFVQNLNAKRALEGELSRSIATIPAISGARVHLVMPKQNLFSSQQVQPSAAVALNVGNRMLTPDQVNSIAQLVAAGVPNLTTTNITVIDQRGTLLFDGKKSESSVGSASTVRRGVEETYENSLTTMLEKVVGMGQVAVHVTADVNLEKVEESSEIYDPQQQVVRSEQTIESGSSSADGGGNPVGVQGNTPDGTTGASAGGGNSSENRTETTTNYEITKTVRQLTKQGGEIKKLSVAVLVAGKTAEDSNGKPAYTPYTDEELARFKKLVQTAIGFDAGRGDTVEVTDMPFTAPPEPPAVDEPFMTKGQMIQSAQYGLLIVALLLIAFLVVKPALDVLLRALSVPSMSTPLPPLQAGPGMAGMAPGMAGGAEPEASTINIAGLQGRVKESAVKKVQEVIDQHPEESLNVVRNWMASGASNRQMEDM